MFIIKEMNTKMITKTQNIRDIYDIVLNITNDEEEAKIATDAACNMTDGKIYMGETFSIRCIIPNYKERLQMVRSMDFIMSCMNDENIYATWISFGVADGDIDENTTDEMLMSYVENDDMFSGLMNVFTKLMKKATKDKDIKGVLYCDKLINQ